jgi:hypothetical protein
MLVMGSWRLKWRPAHTSEHATSLSGGRVLLLSPARSTRDRGFDATTLVRSQRAYDASLSRLGPGVRGPAEASALSGRMSTMSTAEPNHAAYNADAFLEHERELFKVEDGRIAALETQATAVIAAAIAIAAFFFAVRSRTVAESVVVLGTGALALFSGLIARADTPLRTGNAGEAKRRAVDAADEAVRKINVREADPVDVRMKYAQAWQTRARSAGHRLAVKRQWLRVASTALGAQFVVAVIAGAS